MAKAIKYIVSYILFLGLAFALIADFGSALMISIFTGQVIIPIGIFYLYCVLFEYKKATYKMRFYWIAGMILFLTVIVYNAYMFIPMIVHFIKHYRI